MRQNSWETVELGFKLNGLTPVPLACVMVGTKKGQEQI